MLPVAEKSWIKIQWCREKLLDIQSGRFAECFMRLQSRGVYHGIDLNCWSSLKFIELVRSLIFYSPHCTVECLCLSQSSSRCPVFTFMFLPRHAPIVPLGPQLHSQFMLCNFALSQFLPTPPPPPPLIPALSPHVVLCPLSLFFFFFPAMSHISLESGAGLAWQADGTDEDDRDWLIPNLLSPCHSRQQRREGSKREREREAEGDGAS